VNSSILNIAIT